MENKELLLEEIEEFNKQGDESKPLSSSLENFIEHVAKSGTHVFPWQSIRKIYIRKLKSVLSQLPATPVPPTITDESTTNHFANRLPQISYSLSQKAANVNELNANIQNMKDRILERMESFPNAPFTIQRISELLVKPQIHYKRADKFLRGLEKCIMVVTTVDSEGKKIFIDNTIINGMVDEQLPPPPPPPPLPPPPPPPPLLSDRTMTPPPPPPPLLSQPTSQTNSIFSSFEYFTTVNYQAKSESSKEEGVIEVSTTTATSTATLTRSLSIDMHEEPALVETRLNLKREQALTPDEEAEVAKRPRTKSNNDETPQEIHEKEDGVNKVNGGEDEVKEESVNDNSIDQDQPMENDENVQPVAMADSSGQEQQQQQAQPADQQEEATN